MGQTDKQYDGQLMDMYATLRRIKKLAEKGDSDEVVKAIEEEMALIKAKLQPTELPE